MASENKTAIVYTGHGVPTNVPEKNAKPNKKDNATTRDLKHPIIDSTFATRFMTQPIPKLTIPETGYPSNVVYQVIKDMRTLDARPNLNLASFVTTWMEPEARTLMMESLDVNFVNADEYPSCTTISNRCISMLAKLFHSPAKDDDPIGAACVGSSEAIMLCGLAMKKRWKGPGTPNLVMGSETHVCWEKFCRYWDVEPRYVPAAKGRYIATPNLLGKMCDENTIGVVAVFGTTYTGEFEDVEGIDAMVSKINKERGLDIVVHVDAASGGFVAPFVYPDLKFDFRLPTVASINVSGHKYGLVYPGIGWAIWRDAKALPESMVFYADYLGSLERTITMNFSRGASQIIGQYYQFLRLGMDGYRKIMQNLMIIMEYTRKAVKDTGHFEILSKKQGIPLVAFCLKKTILKRSYDETHVSEHLRTTGFVVPAYNMPKGTDKRMMMRITIREDFSLTMADEVVTGLKKAVEWLETHFTTVDKQQGEEGEDDMA